MSTSKQGAKRQKQSVPLPYPNIVPAQAEMIYITHSEKQRMEEIILPLPYTLAV